MSVVAESRSNPSAHHMTDPSFINLRILQQGAILVNEARAHRAATSIVCIYLDLQSKYAGKPTIGHEKGRPPRLYLGAEDNTLKVNENVPRNMDTVVEFTDYTGWEVFSCSDPARHTVALTLVAQEGAMSLAGTMTSIRN